MTTPVPVLPTVLYDFNRPADQDQTLLDLSGNGWDMRLGTSTTDYTRDPTWTTQGLRNPADAFVVGDRAPYQVNAFCDIYVIAADALQDAILFTCADNSTVKLQADGTTRYDQKRSDGSFRTPTGPTYAANQWFVLRGA